MKRFAKQFRHAAVQLPEIPHSAHITRREAGHIRVLFFQKFRSGHRCALFRAGADDLSDLAVQLHLRQIRVHGSFQCGKHCAVIHSFSNIHLRLYGIILFTADNALVVIFNEVHGKLACILDGLAVDKVLPEGLLHQHITAVFFILQDAADAGNGPLRRILGAPDALLFQFLFDHPQAGPSEIAFIDPSDDLRLFRNDLWLTILTFAVAIQLFILDADLSGFHGTAFTPCDIGGDGFTFRLGEGPGEGDSQLTVLLQRIDIFLLEDDCDAKLFERPDIVEAVHRVAGEAGNRLGQDHIHLNVVFDTK